MYNVHVLCSHATLPHSQYTRKRFNGRNLVTQYNFVIPLNSVVSSHEHRYKTHNTLLAHFKIYKYTRASLFRDPINRRPSVKQQH